MKKIIIALLLFVSVLSSAQDVVWHTDMQVAAELAQKEKKPLLLFFTGSDWCGWCIRLQKEVLLTDEFKTWAIKNVILVELDFPRRTAQEESVRMQNQNLQQLLNVRGYPTIWFVKAEKGADNKTNLAAIGSTGYINGGSKPWLAQAESILKSK